MRKVTMIAAILAGLFATSPAFAGTVTVSYWGTVDSWGAGVTGFSVGDKFHVAFSYDDTVPNSSVSNSPDVGVYNTPFISVNGGYSNGLTFSINNNPPGGYIGVVNDVLVNGVPGLDVVGFNFSVHGTSIGGLSPRGAGVRLADDTHTALTSGALPDHVLPLALFNERQFVLIMSDSERVLGTINTPIPAALPLFASALAALGFLGWRRAASPGQ